MSEPVDVYIKDTTPSSNPIENVQVAVYSQAGDVFFTRANTDASGHVGFLLPPNTYSLRFFKNHVSFSNPQQITVLEQLPPPAPAVPPNVFDVSGEVFVLPIASNPRFCRCSGFFKDVSGGPKQFLDMHFIAKFAPLILEGDAVVTERQRIRTDEEGYASICLVRCGQYDVVMEALEDSVRLIAVPDTPSANLPDLLFPVVDLVDFDVSGPYTLTVGQELVLTPTVLTSAGVVLEGTSMFNVQWSSSDESVAAVLPTSDTITIRGVSSGTAELQATRIDDSIIRIPDTPIQGVPVAITVL